jgi:hypothetical protein
LRKLRILSGCVLAPLESNLVDWSTYICPSNRNTPQGAISVLVVRGVMGELVSGFPEKRKKIREFFDIGRCLPAVGAYLPDTNSELRVPSRFEP